MPSTFTQSQTSQPRLLDGTVATSEEGRCRTIVFQGEPMDVHLHPSHLPPVTKGDPVQVVVGETGTVSLLNVLVETPNSFGAQIQMGDQVARTEFPEGVHLYEIVLGDSLVRIHRSGVVEVSGDTVSLEADGLMQLNGAPLALG